MMRLDGGTADVMRELTEIAAKLLIELPGSPCMVHIHTHGGVRVEGKLNDRTLAFFHNLGGSGPPKKAEAVRIIESILEFQRDLRSASKEYDEFCLDRDFEIELYVFSGHMDFPVARWARNAIAWEVHLG
jgi:hypothetical protein